MPLHNIRYSILHYTLHSASQEKSPREITASVRDLKLQIARVNEMIWLPLRPLVTAPLSEADLSLYARNLDSADRLARQIVRNDGVILITGYRGVGKSTFIYMALSKLSLLQKHQTDVPWQVVPIWINLAKATNVSSVLRLCIRALNDNLLEKPLESTERFADSIQLMPSNITKLLKEDEKEYIRWANLRASYKVNLQQDESITTLKQLQATLDLKLSDLAPKAMGSLLPGLGFQAKKEWNSKVDHTIALLDYDEDRAEEDIIHLIKLLVRPRTNDRGEKIRIKLTFIFDEMDKMDEKEGQLPLIQQLKNLFLTRHTVFLLVTSKEFYYLLLSEQKREDAILSSYFSSVLMIPLFSTEETTQLLKQLILIPTQQFTPKEEIFIRNLAGYLTYRAKGVPRDIIRQLQEIQHWVPESLQQYIVDRPNQTFIVQIYAQIQQVLERLVESENMIGSTPMESESLLGDEVKIAPERFWMNEERKDQIKRGLYILIEELLDRGSLALIKLNLDGKAPERILQRRSMLITLNTEGRSLENNEESNLDGRVLESIFEGNFKMLLPFQYNSIIENLAKHLKAIHLDNDQIFSKEAHGIFDKLSVSLAFYQLTRHPVSRPLSEVVQKNDHYSFDWISDKLGQNSLVSQWRALDALQQVASPDQELPAIISAQLYHIFITENEGYRKEAARYLHGSAFFENAEKDEQSWKLFISQETNEQLLQGLIRLIYEGVINNLKNSHLATKMLLGLLDRYRQISNARDTDSTTSLKPTFNSIMIEVVTKLAQICEEDVLELVVKCLDPYQDLSKDLLRPLVGLSKNSNRNLVELLVSLNFSAISLDTIGYILAEENYNVALLWSHMISRQYYRLPRQVLIAILRQLSRVDPGKNTALENSILNWLNSDLFDTLILKEAAVGNPQLHSILEKIANRPGYDLTQERLARVFSKTKAEKGSRTKGGILILGEAGAGKTRLAFEALTNTLPSWPILRWRPDYTVERVPAREFLHGQRLVIFIDNLEDYVPTLMKDTYERPITTDPRIVTLRTLLEMLRQDVRHLVIVATCRLEDVARVEAGLSQLFTELVVISLPRFNLDARNPEAVKIIAEFKKHGVIQANDWDGVLGSLVLGLSKKNHEYLRIRSDSAGIVLRAMKLLTLGGITEHTEQRIKRTCADVFGEKELEENRFAWLRAVKDLTLLQFVTEEIDEVSLKATLVIRKDIYFDKVITDYPMPNRSHQLKKDIMLLQQVMVGLKDTSALLDLGTTLHTFKWYQEALATFDQILTLEPNESNLAAANAGKGVVLHTLKQYQQALVAFDHALTLDPNLALAYLNKGNTLVELKLYEQALVAFDHALTLDPDNNAALSNQAKLLEKLNKMVKPLRETL